MFCSWYCAMWGPPGLCSASARGRITPSTRRQRVFVVTQIAASFVLLAGASMLISNLVGLQSIHKRLPLAEGAGYAERG
jgi:hypothetical protein